MSERPPDHRHIRPAREPATSGSSLVRWEGGSISVAELVHAASEDPGYALVLWVESGSERVVGARFTPHDAVTGVAAELLEEAMRQPGSGLADRPAEVLVTDEALATELRARFAGPAMRVRLVTEVQSWRAVVKEFGAFLAARWPGRSYLGGRDVTPECVEQFFQAAAVFYRAAPWRVLEESPIELRLAERSEPLYAVVLGHDHQVHGMTLYLSGASLKHHDLNNAHPMRTRGAIALTFDREDGIPPPMLEERRTYRWLLAGPAAFPLPYRRLTDGTMREPDAEELDLLTLALRAVAEFIRRHAVVPGPGERIEEAVQLQGATGDSIARLTFPARLEDAGYEG
jgi:hypothetical protein